MPSRIYDKKKYWCGINLEGHGYCKNDNKKNSEIVTGKLNYQKNKNKYLTDPTQ